VSNIIALDYDGVIADTNQIKSDWIAENLGLDVPPWLCDRTECVPIIGLENYNRMSPIVYGREASLRAQPVPGALEAVRALQRTYRLIIVTARTTEQIQWTREWLRQQRVEDAFGDILSSSGGIAKAEIVRQIGAIALIEDDVRHLLKWPEIRFVRIHLSPHVQGNASEPGIAAASDWPMALSLLQGMNQHTSGRL
jgi:hypothetical protein